MNLEQHEIGGPEKARRGQRAESPPKPRKVAPAVQPIASAETPKRLPGATPTAKPKYRTPRAAKTKTRSDAKPLAPTSPYAATVAEIDILQRIRKSAINAQKAANQRTESLIASLTGYRIDVPDRKAVFARAKAYRLSVEGGGESQPPSDIQSRTALSFILPLIGSNAEGRARSDEDRTRAESAMKALAEELPVADFAKGIRGLGLLGLAVIVGEAGIPIGEYRTVSGLWKRLGLAVINGERQRKKKDKAAAKEHGYDAERRAEIWAICSDSLFRHQWRGAKDADGKDPAKSGAPVAMPAHPIGPYGEVYQKRRQHTAQRVAETAALPKEDPQKWTPGRCHNDARRVMTKALMRDLWVEWRAAAGKHEGTP